MELGVKIVVTWRRKEETMYGRGQESGFGSALL